MTLAANAENWFVNLSISSNATVWICLLPVVLILFWCWLRRRKRKRWYFWPLPLVLPFILVTMLAVANNYYGYYSRLGDVFDIFPFPTASVEALHATTEDHPQGVSVQTAIDGKVSKVGPHPTLIWLPPQYFEKPTLDFPVVYVIAGSPGTYTDWSLGGNVPTTALAAAKDDRPAIVVSVSVSSDQLDDTECVNGTQGNWQTYLTVDVPKYINENVRTLTGPRGQAMAGLSMGGYCAQVAALRNPQKFGVFGNFSGSTVPTYSSMADLFGQGPGLRRTVESYSSDWIVENKPESRTAVGQLLIGQQDDPALIADQQQFTANAKRLGMQVEFDNSIQGDHSFYFWTTAFQEWLPWALARMDKPAP